MMDPYPYPLQMKVVKRHVYVWRKSGIHSMWVWSRFNQCIMASFSTKQRPPGFQPTSQIWTIKCGGSGLMMDPYPHLLHMKVVKRLVYVWRKSEIHVHVGLEPQPMHKGFIRHQVATQDFSRLPKSGQSSVVTATC